jgi:hypothetical protein
MPWTAWGPDGADGKGYFGVKSCHPELRRRWFDRVPGDDSRRQSRTSRAGSTRCARGWAPYLPLPATTDERSAVVYMPGRLMRSEPDLHASVNPHQGAVGEAGGWTG